jgi:uncharacterized iron-regulated membrane protein
MYTVLRKIHLYSCFIVASFLLMYFVTGGVMVFESVFPRKNKSTTIQTLAVEKNKSEQQVMQAIRSELGIQGRLRITQSSDGKSVYHFRRPGYQAELTRIKDDSVRVLIKEGTLGSVMNDFHRLRGYEGNWTHKIWAFMYDLSCVGLIIFAFSGVYLWWRLEKNKMTGIAFLLTSTIITGFTILYLYQVS